MLTSVSYNKIVSPLSVLIIGASGGRGRLYAECADQRKDLRLEGIVKHSREIDLTGLLLKPHTYEHISKALQKRRWDAAIISVPHALHDAMTRLFIEAGVKLIIKEKPLATSHENAQDYAKLIKNKNIEIVTTTQRMIQPSFLKGLELLSQIGDLESFEYSYHFALPEMTSGWRAKKELALGGVIMDMGYHALDILHLYFGPSYEINSEVSYKYESMQEQQLEDKAEISLIFENIKGHLSIDRHALQNQEKLKVKGSKGSLEITPSEVIFYNISKEEVSRYSPAPLTKQQQIHLLFDRCLQPEYTEWRQKAFERNLVTVKVIDQIYKQLKIKSHQAMQISIPDLSKQALSIKVGSHFEHYKGLPYVIVAVSRHSETFEELVTYQAQYGQNLRWTRPVSMFLENVTVNGQIVPRFKFIK